MHSRSSISRTAILLTTAVPYVGNKLGKRNTLILGYFLQAVGFVIVYLAGTSLPLMIAGLVIKGIGLAPIASLLIPMIGDVIEYEERCSGLRLAGLVDKVDGLIRQEAVRDVPLGQQHRLAEDAVGDLHAVELFIIGSLPRSPLRRRIRIPRATPLPVWRIWTPPAASTWTI